MRQLSQSSAGNQTQTEESGSPNLCKSKYWHKQEASACFSLFHKVGNLLLVIAHKDCVFVYTFDCRLRNGQRLDVHVTVGEYGRYLAQQSHLVLRKYGYYKFFVHLIFVFYPLRFARPPKTGENILKMLHCFW